jgi:hypothetical protein
MGKRVETPFDVGGLPTGDGFAANTEEIGYLGLGVSQLTTTQGTQAQTFQHVIGQLTSVRQGDRHETFLRRAKAK